MIIVIYLVRCTRFRPHFGVLTMVLLYLFCAARLLLPLEFPHAVIVSDSVVYPRIYSFLTSKPEPVTHLPVGLLLCAIWLFGTVFLLIHYALQYRKAIRAARQARPWGSRTASLLSEIRRQTGRTIKVRGRTAANIESAFGVGVLRRYIILPNKTYTDAELHYIRLHEYTHFLNHDTAVKLLVTLYCIIFWWNPVVYLLQKDLEQTLELKCDRAIAQTLNAQERTAYLRAILSAMKQGCTQQPCRSRPRPCFAPRRTRPCGALHRRARLRRAAERPHRKRRTIGSFAVPLALSYAVLPQPAFSRRPSLTAARPSILTTRMPISSKRGRTILVVR
ncbi:MAG: M56 family metallopeptidase [Butyricicoccus sp.]